MGIIADSNVWIHFERSGQPIDFSAHVLPTEQVHISTIIASELLMGVHRADTEERRQRRSFFVESILAAVAILDFTTSVARLHAEIYAELAKKGQLIGAHDLLTAATAKFHGLGVLTNNVAEFLRVPGLKVIPFK